MAYCASNAANGLPAAQDCAAADAVCACLAANCDILPGYTPTTKVSELIGSELTALAQAYDPNGDPPSDDIYIVNGSGEVLIEIIVLAGRYNEVVTYLSASFGITPADFIDDRIATVNDELLITVFFPINGLLDLNQQGSIVNFARPVPPALGNAGLISSQGDFAQGSFFARQGWNLSGAGVKVGIISDSYATNAAARDNDINNGDLPGAANPVVAVKEYPFGPASDEGRAMLQIVHDVAPEAQLFFHTGFISEGNLAFAIRRLRQEYQCDVIVDDVQYVTEPFFRDGLAARAIDEVVADGAAYFSSAGNFGARSLLFEDGKLVYQRTGRPKMELLPLSPTSFALKDDPDLRFTVEIENGEAAALVLESVNGWRERMERQSAQP